MIQDLVKCTEKLNENEWKRVISSYQQSKFANRLLLALQITKEISGIVYPAFVEDFISQNMVPSFLQKIVYQNYQLDQVQREKTGIQNMPETVYFHSLLYTSWRERLNVFFQMFFAAQAGDIQTFQFTGKLSLLNILFRPFRLLFKYARK